MSDISEKVKKDYQEKFDKYGLDSRSLQWHQKGAAHQRFRQFWAEIDFNNKSVLDVGCGFGEMGKFLSKRYDGVRYTGVDIVPEFIDEAKKSSPQYEFKALDYFENPLADKFDIVMSSGVLNLNIKDNMGYRKSAVKVMFEHAKKVLAFNMLGSHPRPVSEAGSNVWYADSLEVLEYCFSLTRRVILRHNYHPVDFTIFMYPVKKIGK
jgi:SAM-dependent methyltransferase